MTKPSNKIVFFGSGPVAAASLDALRHVFLIEAVVTKKSPAHHRGAVPVDELAKKQNLNLLYANSKSELDDIVLNANFDSEMGVIVDYGVITSKSVLESFRLGIINSHFSLLPKWRGADPITFTVLSGQKETGVSLMRIVEALDEGPLLAQEKIPVPSDITTPALTEILIEKSNRMMVKYLPKYMIGAITPTPQPNIQPTYSRKLTKADGAVDWTKSAEQLEREIRAFAGWPKSYTKLGNVEIVITKASVVENSSLSSGEIDITDGLIVGCGENALRLEELKPAGKNTMNARAFIAGYKNRIA